MLLGIGGISRSGKTKLAKEIARWMRQKGKSVVVLHQDACIMPESQIPTITRDGDTHIDWEHPDSIDWVRWEQSILEAKKTHDVVIAEGLFAFWKPEINALFDQKLFVSIREETFYKRKANDKRWGEEPDWYVKYIWEAYQQYGKVPENLPDVLYISGEKPLGQLEMENDRLIICGNY